MKRKRKKLRRYEYNFGGFLKKIAPTAVAAGVSAIPGVGPAVAPLAAGVTSAAINSGTEPVKNPRMRSNIPYSASSIGYKYGGKMKYATGGGLPITQPLPGGGKKYNGPRHEQGGIPIDQAGNPTSPDRATAEVEGGETEQDGYIFSDSLTVPGTQMTFAEAHERMLANNVDKSQIMKLRQMQERAQKQAGVQGGDDQAKNWGSQGYQRMKGGGDINIKESKKGTFTKAAKKRGMGVQEFAKKVLNNKDQYSTAMVKKANFARNAKKWNKYGGKYLNGGDLTPGYTGVDEDLPMYDLSTKTATKTPGVNPLGPGVGRKEGGFDKAMQTAGYVVPSLTRGAMALTNPDVKRTPQVRAGRVPVQSSVFTDTKRRMAGDYRAILADPNASRNQKLAAQAQLQKGRSQVAGKEADYRGRMQQFNVQAGQKADAINAQNFQRDREAQAREDAMEKKLLTQAIEMPITAYNADKAGKKQQIANVMVDAGKMSDPVARENHIRRSLRAIGLSPAEIQNILRTNNF